MEVPGVTAEVAEEPRPAQAEDAHIEEPSGTTASKVGRKGGKKRAAAKAAKSFEGDFEEFATAADAALQAANGEPVMALTALAEAICRHTGYSGKLGAGAVLYNALQAQLSRKGGGSYRGGLQDRGGDELDASLALTTSRARSPQYKGRDETESGKPRPSPYELPHPHRRARQLSPLKASTSRSHGARAASTAPRMAPASDAAEPAADSQVPAGGVAGAQCDRSSPTPETFPPETSGAEQEVSGADRPAEPASDLVSSSIAPAGDAAAKASRKGVRAKSPSIGRAKAKAKATPSSAATSAQASAQGRVREKAASRKGSPSKGHGLSFPLPPLSPGRSALESHQSRESLRSRTMSAPVRDRPQRGGQQDRHERHGSTLGSQGGSLLAARRHLRARTTADDSRLGSRMHGTATAGDPLDETSAVDIRTWLKERRKKDALRERMLQGRVRREERFLEMLDDKQAERNKQLQEAEERMAQSVAVAKKQKWKPVPFTPWPVDGKDKQDSEAQPVETALMMDVERLFGDAHLQHAGSLRPGLGGLMDEGKRSIAAQRPPQVPISSASILVMGGGGSAGGGGSGGGARHSVVSRGAGSIRPM